MPRLSLYRPNRTNDYQFFDRTIHEQFTVGGLDIYVHRYLGPKTGDRRVLRGGSYGLPAYKHSSAMRGFKDPNLHNEFGGIRLCSRKFSD